jgi:hypothetical protein
VKSTLKSAHKLLLAFVASATLAAAQSATPAPPPDAPGPATPPLAGADGQDASNIVLAPKRPDYVAKPATDSDGVARSVSPSVAAALTEGLPKYSPPTPTPQTAAEPQDLRDIDKPKNEIPRLPKYVVHERRPPVFRDRDLFTDSGLLDLSFKSHPGLNVGNVLGLNEGPARQMIYDDMRQKNIEDLNETAYSFAQGGDPAEAQSILSATQDAFMRTDDLGGPVGGGLLGGAGK